jgi:RNA polymerase sigma-70 factor (ECF subfamily)
MAHMTDPGSDTVDRHQGLTSIHVRRAIEGDSESLAWLWQHVYPLLHRHAVMRIGRMGAGHIDPHDLVAEAWAATLPRLRDLVARNGRFAPVLLTFLGTTITNLANERLRKFSRETSPRLATETSVAGDPLDGLPAKLMSVSAVVAQSELSSLISSELDALSPEDRQVIFLRCMDGLKNDEAAKLLNIPPNTVAQRYHRAIQRLRERIPGAFFHEFSND